MKGCDVLVVGAGIAGLSVARELAQLKAKVTILEKEEAGGKASRAAAGILDPYTEAREESPMLELGLKAFDFYPDFLKGLGKGASGEVEYEKPGMIYLALSREDEAFLNGRFLWQKKRGLPVESLSGGEILKAEPGVTKRVRGGILYPEIRKLNAGSLTQLLFQSARTAGVEFRTTTRELSVSVESGSVRGVNTSEGFAEAPIVVLAAGCWTGLDPLLGISIQVSPVRGQILILHSPDSFSPRHILHTVRYAYAVPWPEHRLLVGSTLESAGYDEGVTPEAQRDILERAGEMIESLGTFPIEASWSGLRPFAEKGPLIGPTRVRGLFLATAFYRSGILIGPLVGKLLAEGIRSGKFSPLLEPFYP